MGRPSKTRGLDVWMNGEHVGRWTISPQGRHQFAYEASWLDSPFARPVSLSLPLAPPDAPHQGPRVEAFFDNLLPDSPDIRRRVQARFAAPTTSAFDLLAEIGRDCVGALQLLPEGRPPENVRTIQGTPLKPSQVASLLRSTVSSALPGTRESDAFRISLAGFQEKTALLRHKGRWHRPEGSTPSTHIFKLPLGKVGPIQADLSTSVENEWLCSRIIRAYGIPIASCEMALFEDQRVLIVERFDRRLSEDGAWWIRLPQEDMCQALGAPLGLKYESDGAPGAAEILTFLLGSRQAAEDRRTFFKAQALFWMLGATDGHARNFSLFIGRAGGFSMTPLYDVLSAYPILGRGRNKLAPEKARMAMSVRGRSKHYHWSRITRRHWLESAKAWGMADQAPGILAELIDTTPEALRKIQAVLPGDFPANVAEPILKGLDRAAKALQGPA